MSEERGNGIGGRAGSKPLAWTLALAVAVFSASLYAKLGNPAAIEAAPEKSPEDVSPEAMQAMLANLARRLQTPSSNPASDAEGWTMLARSYAALQRFAEADAAFARAIALKPGDAQLLADRADVLAVVQGQRTEGEPDRLIAEALRIDPRNLKALALAGTAAYERHDLAGARGFWQQARAIAPAGSEFAQGLDRSLAEVGVPTAQASTSPARITGRVSLSSGLATRAAPGDTVFIFARAAEGPRMPLAVVRRTVADLPFDFTLDDSLAMSPQARLSSASRVVVGARISRSGSAMPQPGDLQADSAAVDNRTDGLALQIDQVQP